jgi:hypothetical protein
MTNEEFKAKLVTKKPVQKKYRICKRCGDKYQAFRSHGGTGRVNCDNCKGDKNIRLEMGKLKI